MDAQIIFLIDLKKLQKEKYLKLYSHFLFI
jgi:hypothetical protein